MKDWLGQMADGLAYIHSRELKHRSIKPSKFLIIGDRIMYGNFGLVPSQQDTTRSLYAPPELISRNKRLRSGDVFALGCVYLEMMTVMKALTLQQFRSYRAREDGNVAFHATLGKVASWAERLEDVPRDRQPEDLAVESTALSHIMSTVEWEYSKRPKAPALSASFQRWNSWRSVNTHGDLARFSSDKWKDLRALNSFYSSNMSA
jgi:serine/threonine protein kinase